MKSLRTTSIAIALLLAPAVSVRAAYVTERSFSTPDGNLVFTLERDDADNRFTGRSTARVPLSSPAGPWAST